MRSIKGSVFSYTNYTWNENGYQSVYVASDKYASRAVVVVGSGV